jgi:hypothetical protein
MTQCQILWSVIIMIAIYVMHRYMQQIGFLGQQRLLTEVAFSQAVLTQHLQHITNQTFQPFRMVIDSTPRHLNSPAAESSQAHPSRFPNHSNDMPNRRGPALLPQF